MLGNLNKKNKLKKITKKLPSNNQICSEILEILGNKKTKVILDSNIKNNYYVFLNNTIYLSNNEKSKEKYQRLCIIAHECIHSMQNKLIQIINFILSNIELILFALVLICIVLNINIYNVFNIYILINIISIIPRLILEVDASLKSINLSYKYIENKLDTNDSIFLIKNYKIQIVSLLPMYVVFLFFGKFFRVFIIYLIKYNI